MSSSLVIRDLQAPGDPDALKWHRLLARVFAEPEFILPYETLERVLTEKAAGRSNSHCLALKEGDEVVGGSLFRYLPRTNTAFSGYLFLAPETRGKGYGRAIVEERRRILRADAQAHGQDDIQALFIDVVAPDRLTPEALARESRTMDPWERRRFMGRMGFYKVDTPFFQLPLSEEHSLVTWLDLLCHPVRPDWAARRSIPGDFVIQVLTELWSSIHPHWEKYIGRIADVIAGREVALLDPVPPRPASHPG